MADKPQQQILVPFDFTPAAEHALHCGITMARIFNCGLSVVYAAGKRVAGKKSEWDNVKSGIMNRLVPVAGNVISVHRINTSVYVFRGRVDEVIYTFYERINAIMMVAGLNLRNKETKAFLTLNSIVNKFRELRIPVLVVQGAMIKEATFSNIIMPVDFNKEAKEKSSWAGFFSELNRSKITLLSRNYRDPFFSAQLQNNLNSVRKFFTTANVTFEEKNAGNIRGSIDSYSLEYARAGQGDMIILMATSERGIDDFFMGPPEKRIIAAAHDIPVLLLNPRDDLYLPCV